MKNRREEVRKRSVWMSNIQMLGVPEGENRNKGGEKINEKFKNVSPN